MTNVLLDLWLIFAKTKRSIVVVLVNQIAGIELLGSGPLKFTRGVQ